LHIIAETISEVATVDIIIGKLFPPTASTVLIFSVKPNIITAHCNIFFEVNVIPALIFSFEASFGNIAVIIIPNTIENTGAPITSNEKSPTFRPAKNVDIPAIIAQIIIPTEFFLRKFIVASINKINWLTFYYCHLLISMLK
jgi:hypothetical protein